MPVTVLGMVLLSLLQVPGPRVGADLRAGMQLIYGSDPGAQPPWAVERAEIGVRLKADQAFELRSILQP